jgi:hypothetical protein
LKCCGECLNELNALRNGWIQRIGEIVEFGKVGQFKEKIQ